MTRTGQIHSRRELFVRMRDSFRHRTPAARPVPASVRLPDYIRPPGAALEARFLELCERCDDCATACPHDAIVPLGPAFGDAVGTPAILPRHVPCKLCDDLPCAAACPTNALSVIPVAEVRMGVARLDTSLCWAAMGQPCDYCITECPLGSRAIRLEGMLPVIVEEGCVGCGMCVHICTATTPALRIEAAHLHT